MYIIKVPFFSYPPPPQKKTHTLSKRYHKLRSRINTPPPQIACLVCLKLCFDRYNWTFIELEFLNTLNRSNTSLFDLNHSGLKSNSALRFVVFASSRPQRRMERQENKKN